MRILHLTPYYKPAYAFGGVVRSVEGMATALVKRGHEVTVLTTDARDQQGRRIAAPEETIDGVRVLRRPNALPWLRARANLSTPRSMKKTAEALLPGVDILHAHEFRTLENLLVSPVAQGLNVPIALSPHGTLNLNTGRGRLKTAWDRLLSAGIAQRINHVIALTETPNAWNPRRSGRHSERGKSQPDSASSPTALIWDRSTSENWLKTFARATALSTRRQRSSWAACKRAKASICSSRLS